VSSSARISTNRRLSAKVPCLDPDDLPCRAREFEHFSAGLLVEFADHMTQDEERIAIRFDLAPESHFWMLGGDSIAGKSQSQGRAIVERDLREFRPCGENTPRGNSSAATPVEQAPRFRPPAKPLEIANDRIDLPADPCGECLVVKAKLFSRPPVVSRSGRAREETSAQPCEDLQLSWPPVLHPESRVQLTQESRQALLADSMKLHERVELIALCGGIVPTAATRCAAIITFLLVCSGEMNSKHARLAPVNLEQQRTNRIGEDLRVAFGENAVAQDRPKHRGRADLRTEFTMTAWRGDQQRCPGAET
jgi:hypothetical protein